MPRRSTSPLAPAPKRRLCDISEAAEYLGVHQRTIRNYIAEGRLTAYRVGDRLLRLDMTEVDALVVACAPHQVSR